LAVSLDGMWKALSERDLRYDGSFVYAVRSTTIYCRPSCASRKPRPDRVVFFSGPREAQKAGFRACLRCKPDKLDPIVTRISAIGSYMDSHPDDHLTLKTLGERFKISPYHLQRSFKRVTGISPRQYAEGARLNKLKLHLKRGESVRRSTYEAGRSSTGWLYRGKRMKLGMEASSYKTGGRGRRIAYSIVPCALGQLLVAGTAKGICMVGVGDSEKAMITALRAEYPNASLSNQAGNMSKWIRIIVDYLEGEGDDRLRQLPIEIRATVFQRQVWNELCSIPAGATRTYSEVAERIGRPRAVRAVARACATNPVAIIIPCHRVIGKDGSLTGYRWGADRKLSLLRIDETPLAEQGPEQSSL
jgi:AraC family transcriptional regulator, regulatory protein of adaptative response / methylated-DNA-[protein]-cysteine methyltransferase